MILRKRLFEICPSFIVFPLGDCVLEHPTDGTAIAGLALPAILEVLGR